MYYHASSLFIGDMVFDVQAAKKAGVRSVAIATGYHSKERLLAEKPDYLVDSLAEFQQLVVSLL